MKIKTFTDLDAWKLGHELVLYIYMTSKKFPVEEKFGLSNQIRRATVSITSNIAEGFSRKSSKEKIQFYRMSLGSLDEVHNQSIIAKDLNYISVKDFESSKKLFVTVNKLVNGLIKYSVSGARAWDNVYCIRYFVLSMLY